MSNRISDFPPLLPLGEHVRTVDELRELCVKPFRLSTTRWSIMDGFRKIVELLEREYVPCELIIDGSFLTEEINPEDIDFAVVVTPEFYENCTAAQLALLDWIADSKDIKATHLCDCYLCVEYGEGHPIWFEGINNRSWWVNFYSKSKIEKRERGVAFVKLSMGITQ